MTRSFSAGFFYHSQTGEGGSGKWIIDEWGSRSGRRVGIMVVFLVEEVDGLLEGTFDIIDFADKETLRLKKTG